MTESEVKATVKYVLGDRVILPVSRKFWLKNVTLWKICHCESLCTPRFCRGLINVRRWGICHRVVSKCELSCSLACMRWVVCVSKRKWCHIIGCMLSQQCCTVCYADSISFYLFWYLTCLCCGQVWYLLQLVEGVTLKWLNLNYFFLRTIKKCEKTQ